MNDLISRKAAIDALWGIQRGLQMIDASEGSDITIHGVQLALHKIEQLPSAEPENGSFIGTEYDGYADGNPVYYEWKCSACGCIFEGDEPTYRFCPHCGARMDADHDTDD